MSLPAPETNRALLTVTPVNITNENFAQWGQVVRLPDVDPNAVKVNQGTCVVMANGVHMGLSSRT